MVLRSDVVATQQGNTDATKLALSSMIVEEVGKQFLSTASSNAARTANHIRFPTVIGSHDHSSLLIDA